jgi:hypothetical protein
VSYSATLPSGYLGGQFALTQLVQEVQLALLNRSDLTNDRCVTALNFAQARISRSHDFLEMKTFYQTKTSFTNNSFNDKFITLAPYVKHIHTMVLDPGDTTARKLTHKPWRLFDKTWPTPEVLARSKPYYYSRWGLSVAIVYPVPDNVYRVFCRITTFPRPFNLEQFPSATSDYIWKDDILVALAAAYLWKSYGRMDKANDYLREAQEHFVTAVKQDSDEPDLEVNLDLDDSGNLGTYWANPFVKSAP